MLFLLDRRRHRCCCRRRHRSVCRSTVLVFIGAINPVIRLGCETRDWQPRSRNPASIIPRASFRALSEIDVIDSSGRRLREGEGGGGGGGGAPRSTSIPRARVLKIDFNFPGLSAAQKYQQQRDLLDARFVVPGRGRSLVRSS